MVDLAELRKRSKSKKDAKASAATAAPVPVDIPACPDPTPAPAPPEVPIPSPAPVTPAPAAAGPAIEHLLYLSFEIGKEIYGFPIDPVQEIIPLSRITRVPNATREVMGILSLRGIVLPILDIGPFLGQDLAPPSEDSRIIVIALQDELAGVMVDRVLHTIAVPADQVEPPPATVADDKGLIAGVHSQQDRLLILLKPDQL